MVISSEAPSDPAKDNGKEDPTTNPTPPLISQGFLFNEESSTKEDATAAVRLASVSMSDQGARSHILAFTFFCTKYLAPAKNKMLKTTIYKRYFAWLEKHIPYPSTDPDSNWGSLAKVGVSSYALLNAIFAHVFPISSESRKYISVQWVIPRSTLRPLKELVVCRLLRDHDNTLWFELWSSNAIFWTPLDLRAWTLGFGA